MNGPLGNSRYPSVPPGTSRYLLVPPGISWYLSVTSDNSQVPTGTSWVRPCSFWVPLGASRDLMAPLSYPSVPLGALSIPLDPPWYLWVPPQYLPKIPNPKFTLIIVFSNLRVGWVNSVPQQVNKRTNEVNTVALKATADYKKALLRSTVS